MFPQLKLSYVTVIEVDPVQYHICSPVTVKEGECLVRIRVLVAICKGNRNKLEPSACSALCMHAV